LREGRSLSEWSAVFADPAILSCGSFCMAHGVRPAFDILQTQISLRLSTPWNRPSRRSLNGCNFPRTARSMNIVW
jgi:hypothetical protein